MTKLEFQVTFDAADPGALALFWCEVLGYRIEPPPPGFDDWDAALESWGIPPERRNDRSAVVPAEGDTGPRLFFQKVPETKTAKNRVHLDVRAAVGLSGEARMQALQLAADRLVERGACEVHRVEGTAMDGGFIWMEDPEGNEFCLD